MMKFKIYAIYAIKYQIYLYDRVHTTHVKNLSTTSISSNMRQLPKQQICTIYQLPQITPR